MNESDIRKAAETTVEKAERLERLTKTEGWKDYVELLDQLLQQEITALAGQPLDNNYYKKIGFLQYTNFIKAIPGVVQDPKIREYLLHQGFAKSIEIAKGIPFLFSKQKAMALQQLKQILEPNVGPKMTQQDYNNKIYGQS